MAFLEMNRVSKAYGRGAESTSVLCGVSLHADKGEFVAILGPSGSGKTTLVSLLAGLLQPDEGTIKLGGKIVSRPGRDRGVVFQNYSLLPWLSARDNVRLAVDQMYPEWPRRRRLEIADSHLDLVRLSQAAHKRPGELSGGMRQRVALARALALDPELLLLDEPLSALDALTRANLQDEIGRIWSQSRKTVILITNDVDEAILLADRVIPLSAGPGAFLGPSIEVDLPRPRDRKRMNLNARFKDLRSTIIGALLDGRARPTRAERHLSTPPEAVLEVCGADSRLPAVG